MTPCLRVVLNSSPLQCTVSYTFSEGTTENALKGHFLAKGARRLSVHLTAFLFHECRIGFHGLVLHVK